MCTHPWTGQPSRIRRCLNKFLLLLLYSIPLLPFPSLGNCVHPTLLVCFAWELIKLLVSPVYRSEIFPCRLSVSPFMFKVTITPKREDSKGPFTLGGIPAVSARLGTLPSACCVYIRRETGGKPLASCKWVTDFSLETRYLLLLFLILQNDDDKDGRISANGVSGCTIHYTEKRNDVGEFCTILPAAMTTDFSNMSEFHKRSLRIFYRYLDVTISRQKFREPIFSRQILIVPTKPVAYIGLHVSGMWADWSTSGERFPVEKSLPKRSGVVPLGCHAEINKRLLIGQVRNRAGSHRENRLV